MCFGCYDCLAASVSHISHFYGVERDVQFAGDDAAMLISAMWVHHGIPLALTNLSVDQNWSVTLPVANCRTCRDANRSATKLLETVQNPQEKQGDTQARATAIDTGGLRSLDPVSFVNCNRRAIGFTSIIGNPVLVDTEHSSSLVNAHIRTESSPVECEIAGGKGLSLEQALASCLGEGLERYFLAGAGRSLPEPVGSQEDAVVVEPSVFGFPVNDSHESITPWKPGVEIEYQLAHELTASGAHNALIPSNLIYCPYRPIDGRSETVCTGSTNGVATGATVDDATLQGALELIERDAFWFYARTGAAVTSVPFELYPDGISQAARELPGTFYVHQLPNPFGVPVAQVVYHDPTNQHGTVAARGTGCTASLDTSVARAFAECMQMFHSLGSGIAVEESPYDMRSGWASGTICDELPNFFSNGIPRDSRIRIVEASMLDLDEVVRLARSQGMRVFRAVLAESPHASIVRTIFSSVNIMDDTYFQNGGRFEYFADFLGVPAQPIVYHKSLFM